MHSDPSNESFQVLAECKDGYVGVCLCCREFNYCYKNVLLTFQEPEMRAFFDWLIACRHTQSFETPLPNGPRHMYNSPLYNMFFVFTNEELDEIEQLYSEAKIMLEAMKVLSN